MRLSQDDCPNCRYCHQRVHVETAFGEKGFKSIVKNRPTGKRKEHQLNNFFQDDLLIQEQDNIISELETRFEELELLICTMQGSLNKKNEKEQLLTMGWDQIRSVFIGEKLTGHEVIFYKEDDSYNIKRLVTLVEEAGAIVLGCFNWPQEYEQLESQSILSPSCLSIRYN